MPSSGTQRGLEGQFYISLVFLSTSPSFYGEARKAVQVTVGLSDKAYVGIFGEQYDGCVQPLHPLETWTQH